VVICIDVLRADHVGSYGYSRATTPAIDALATKGITFESAISAAAWTKPSVPSYFTSRFPHQHGVYRGSYWRDGKLLADALGPDEVTLAELFAEHGYRTLALVANPVVDPALGLAQGFDEFVAELRSATELRERFLTRLDALERQQPFFAYIHFNDVHLPYQQPEPYRSIFGDTESPIDFTTSEWKLLKRGIGTGDVTVSAADRRALTNLYDGALRYVDSQIEQILSGLEQRGLLEDSLIVVLSDHGEEIFDHGGIDHGSSLYDELLHVPFILRLPANEHGGLRVATAVSSIDLLPTLAEYLGFEAPAEIAGRSLMPMIDAPLAAEPLAIYSEGIHHSGYQQALHFGEWKYIVTVGIDEHSAHKPAADRPPLSLGLHVEVEGIATADGRFLANSILIRESQQSSRSRIAGVIQALDSRSSRVDVLGFEVEFLPSAKLLDHLGDRLEFSSLHEGQMVAVYGHAKTASRFVAEKLIVRDPAKKAKAKLDGRIASPVTASGSHSIFELVGRSVSFDRKASIVREGQSQEPPAATSIAGSNKGDPWEFALSHQLPRHELLYNLSRDPGELHDLAAAQPAQLEQLRSLLAEIRARSTSQAAPARELNTEQLESLRALGYVD